MAFSTEGKLISWIEDGGKALKVVDLITGAGSSPFALPAGLVESGLQITWVGW